MRLILVVCFAFMLNGSMFSQSTENSFYKNPREFEHFRKQCKQVAKEQIIQLKNGALLVRLATGSLKVNYLLKKGKTELAKKTEEEQHTQNKIIMRAFLDKFDFCPVYFFYSSASDSLLKGFRKGFFLDTNLRVNQAIELHQSFYLIAERDMVYNSSIGFPKPEEAAKVTENGNVVKQVAIVMKDQYFHQLKRPFPFFVKGNRFKKYILYIGTLNNNLNNYYKNAVLN